jgi:hypothetical protein
MAQVAYSFTTIAEDVILPVITLSGDPVINWELGTEYVDPGFAATDYPDGDVSANVVVTGLVDYTTLGTYALYYNVTDNAGNRAEERIRTVKVVSPFDVTRILVAGDVLVVTWDSQPEATYTVWCCSDLGSGKWKEEATVSSQGESTNWVDFNPSSTCKFYRIEIR